jgi:hypothetical protein
MTTDQFVPLPVRRKGLGKGSRNHLHLEVWADPSVIEPDEEGQTTICNAETVRLVLDKIGKVERIWPYVHRYGEEARLPALQCPQCGQKVHSLSGVREGEKHKKLCQQGSKWWWEEHQG